MNGCLHSDKNQNYNNVTKLLVKPNIFTFGLTNPCDANSLATVTVRYISGIPIAHKSLESIKLDFETFKWVYTITPSIVYSIIIIIIILVILCGKRVGGIYVRKYKD